jgi:hypothetical protein
MAACAVPTDSLDRVVSPGRREGQKSPALADGPAAVHVRVTKYFSNVVHYIPATHPFRRPRQSEHGLDVKSLS